MPIMKRIGLAPVILVLLGTVPARAQQARVQQAPVLVELFTSEGCSSCPPADELLARLDRAASGAEIVALELHVDYWNDLGWADPFSAAGFTARQQAYSQALGERGVYTPQMVIDGEVGFLGSNAARAEAAIRGARAKPALGLRLRGAATAATAETPAAPLDLEVTLPALALAAGESAEVLLALTESGLRTAVPRGENAGRTIGHGPVVRALRRLGPIAADAAPMPRTFPLSLQPGWRRQQMRAVVFVQERRSRRVLAVGALSLR